jgi:hypothetical protein
VNRVRKQSDTVREQHDDKLKCSRHEKSDEAPFDSPKALLSGRNRRIDESVCVAMSLLTMPVMTVALMRPVTMHRVPMMCVSVTVSH